VSEISLSCTLPGVRFYMSQPVGEIRISRYFNRISAVFQMYFIIKYNVFNKYIINVTTTGINTCKKIFEFAQREVISFFTLVTNKGEHSIIYSK
jgi:hypothetical protein